MINMTTTQLNNRGGWSGCIKREGEGRIDGRFGGEAKEKDGEIRRGEGRNMESAVCRPHVCSNDSHEVF
jgi:hypothetical protein